ncbi:tetratricopeptide repeat protein [Methylocucumis oryzae]|uniref:Uncharacterized protein n=1 Tax=Methylocucumis oryzae TaxID=1632867 RepID=A0A0F3IKF5_9GAMM|nr:tetratricopeptide repeat protein [Methylocucumis oryzae]KJV06044.1 hypothetical protein VZ94_13830 [Methylocucumis oryzae]
MGFVLHNSRRYDEAEQAYRKAIALDINWNYPWNNLGNLLQDHLDRYDEAEQAYRQAEQLDHYNPYPFANHARLAVKQQAPEKARMLYRTVAELAQAQGQYENLLLQAQLYLGNRDAARLALAQVAQHAQQGEQQALFRLKEQVRELSAMGLGLALAELMQQSSYADFLAPFSLALRATEQPDALDGSAQEIKCMALEVLADITTFRNTLCR